MYSKPPHAGKNASSIIAKSNSESEDLDDADLRLQAIREDDLLVVSRKKPNLGGASDLKAVICKEFLDELLSTEDAMFAFCTHAYDRGAGFVQL